MIKNLLIAYLFTINSVMAGLPPTTLKGQSQTTKPTTFNFQVPNKQATITAASTGLIETGNNNELENAGFEHSTVTTGWTISNATSSSSTTRIEGGKSLSLALTGALSLSQSSTINASQKSGVQMVASVFVNSSDVSDLQLCSLKNGAEDKCTVVGGYVQGSGWRQLSVSFLGNSTSNGLKLKSTDTTGTVLVDQAYVGIGSPIVDFTPDMVYSAKVSSAGVVSNENTDFISGSVTISTGAITGTWTSGVFTVAPNCVAVFDAGPGVATPKTINTTTTLSGFSGASFSSTTKESSAFQIICQKTGADYKTSKAYVASSSDTDWASCGHTTSDFTGFGTVSAIETQCKREGSDLLMRGKFTSGTSTATEVRVNLKLNGSALIAASSPTIPTIQIAGYGNLSAATANQYSVLIEPSVGYITYGIQNATNSGQTKQQGSVFISSGQVLSFFARVPIQGWTDSGVIVGSFQGIEKCANDYECTDTFTATIGSTGVVEYENIPWIASTSSAATGRRQLTYRSILKDGVNPLTSPMNCNVTLDGIQVGGYDYSATIRTNTSALIDIDSKHIAVGGINAKFYISCSKNANDYKPKTAKVASSIGVPTVPGITTEAVDTFSSAYGGASISTVCAASTTCTLYNQIGTGISSIAQGTAGSFTVNFGKPYSKVNCTATTIGASTVAPPVNSGSTPPMSCSNCNSLTFVTGNPASAYVATYGTVNCQGAY